MNFSEQELKELFYHLQGIEYVFEVEEVKNGKYSKYLLSLGEQLPNNGHYYEIANKCGSEYRLYFTDLGNLSFFNKIVSSYGYGGAYGQRNSEFKYRINDDDAIHYMVENFGLRVW